jgi:DNA invertase Pin-like site-specific DNA recombinase
MMQSKYNSQKAIAILRVSSSKQENNTSHSTQEKSCVDYCNKTGLELVKKFEFVESAKDSSKRTHFKDALVFAKKNKIKNILFYQFDRESRNLTDVEMLEQMIKTRQLIIHYVAENKVYDHTTPDSEFLGRDINAALSKNHSRVLSTKVRAAMNQKALGGWAPGNHTPLGYIHFRDRDEYGREMNVPSKIIIDPNPSKAELVLKEFELRAKGLCYAEIRKLNIQSGLVQKCGIRSYTVSAIEQRLKNKMYRGYFDWCGEEYKGKHELFIPPLLITQVDKLNGINGRSMTQKYNAFAGGWLTCACGCSIVFDPKEKVLKKTKQTVVYRYYRCSNGKKAHKSNPVISEEKIMNQFSQAVADINLSEQLAKKISDALNETHRRAKIALNKKVDDCELGIQRIDQSIALLTDKYIAQSINDNAYQITLDRYQKEKAVLFEKLKLMNSAIYDEAAETAKSIIELSKDAKRLWDQRSFDEKVDFLKLLLSNPKLDGLNIEYDLKKPFQNIVNLHENKKWWPKTELNRRHKDFQSSALPTELPGHTLKNELEIIDYTKLSQPFTRSKACFKSANKSSMSSIPTDNLIKESSIPSFFRCSAGTEACVMIAGCSIKDSTPPSDSAKAKTFTDSKNLRDAFNPPLIKKVIIPPKPCICEVAN